MAVVRGRKFRESLGSSGPISGSATGRCDLGLISGISVQSLYGATGALGLLVK